MMIGLATPLALLGDLAPGDLVPDLESRSDEIAPAGHGVIDVRAGLEDQ
jgi:hypothetical protein